MSYYDPYGQQAMYGQGYDQGYGGYDAKEQKKMEKLH